MQNETLIALLGPSADPVAAGWRLRELAENDSYQGADLITQLSEQEDLVRRSDPAILGGLLHVVHGRVIRAAAESRGESFAAVDPEHVRRLDQALPEATPNRHLLLQLLAMIQSDQSLAVLMDRLEQAPPQKWMDAAQAISPLMQNRQWKVGIVFPRLLQCLQFPSLAAPTLDLANFLVRERNVSPHPAAANLTMLNHLLGEVSSRLGRFEENPHAFGDDVETVQATLGEAVSLAVSLCDAVGLIGDETSIGKLNQTVELKHRRVQCEAAGALARLKDEQGIKRLLELTADPAARLRAIAYADELGLGDQIDPELRSDVATAEAEMSLWLTQPQQMGVPPTSLEVIDSRRMLWPSFTDRVDVHLVRFEYSFGEKKYSNVGITGPVTFAFSSDVADLPLEDIYAIYAGWHAEHPEIFAIPAEQFNVAQQRAMKDYVKHLETLEYEEIKPSLLGFFLDEQAGVFTAVRDSTECVVVTDGLETIDQAVAGRTRPLTPGDVFNLYKGRKMLRTFNPSSDV
ncbi:HEAT repeat domain-containing protein [Novipirellula rosea]|uniref:HEAT repeat domain-containing protein n=1 Tax=Novipirellula rosea TaxID=1031540 RepID=A0ABP8NBM4_9BACT